MFVIHCSHSLMPSGFCKNKTKRSYISISSIGAFQNELYKWSFWERFVFAIDKLLKVNKLDNVFDFLEHLEKEKVMILIVVAR